MSTMNFSVPEDIKSLFNKTFAHQNKSHLIAQLMKQAIEEHARFQKRAYAVDALLKLRSKQKPLSEKQVRKIRQEGRE